jgi:hypothetical protein
LTTKGKVLIAGKLSSRSLASIETEDTRSTMSSLQVTSFIRSDSSSTASS